MFGIFKRKAKEPEPAPVEEVVETKAIPEVENLDTDDEDVKKLRTQLHTGIPIMYYDDDGNAIGEGHIHDANLGAITIWRLRDAAEMTEVDEGIQLHISAYNVDLQNVRIVGTVGKSSRSRLVLENWSFEQTTTRRRFKRLPTRIPAVLWYDPPKGKRQVIECKILDLSDGGAQVSSATKLDEGTILSLHFEAFEKDGNITIPSIIRWYKIDTKDFSYRYGLMFSELDHWRHKELLNSLHELERRLIKRTED